jgi:DNA-3-methyladenine glycosylase
MRSPVTPAPEKYRIRRLRRAELPSDTIALARFLIGKVVVRELPEGRLSGRIVETEAYPPGDPAGHHFRGPTPRIQSMYQAPGHAYVFFNYGAHFMLNVSSEPAGTAGGILIRAVEPLEGVGLMKKHRGTAELLNLTRGPGRLAAALRIDRAQDGLDLLAPGILWLGELVARGTARDRAQKNAPGASEASIGQTVRIGLSRAADHLLRFYEVGNPFVSGPKRLLSRTNVLREKGQPAKTHTRIESARGTPSIVERAGIGKGKTSRRRGAGLPLQKPQG